MQPDQIAKLFTYHAPTAGQPEKYEQLRAKAKEFALLVNDVCPESREKSLAITSIQQSVMWANASVALSGESSVSAPAVPAREATDALSPDTLAEMRRSAGGK